MRFQTLSPPYSSTVTDTLERPASGLTLCQREALSDRQPSLPPLGWGSEQKTVSIRSIQTVERDWDIWALINKKTGPPQGSTLALEWCVRGHLQWSTVSSVVAWIEISSRSPLGVGSLIHKPANRGHSEDVKSGTPNTFC